MSVDAFIWTVGLLVFINQFMWKTLNKYTSWLISFWF